MKVAVIGDRYTVAGFKLAGVKIARIARDKEQAQAALTESLRHQGIGVIIIQDSLAALVRPSVVKYRKESRSFPIIVEVPGKEGPLKREEPADELLRKTVGSNAGKGDVKS